MMNVCRQAGCGMVEVSRVLHGELIDLFFIFLLYFFSGFSHRLLMHPLLQHSGSADSVHIFLVLLALYQEREKTCEFYKMLVEGSSEAKENLRY